MQTSASRQLNPALKNHCCYWECMWSTCTHRYHTAVLSSVRVTQPESWHKVHQATWGIKLVLSDPSHIIPAHVSSAERFCLLAPAGTWCEDHAKKGKHQCWPDGKPLQIPQQEGGCGNWGCPGQYSPFHGWSLASFHSINSLSDCPVLVSQYNSAQGRPFTCKASKQTWFFCWTHAWKAAHPWTLSTEPIRHTSVVSGHTICALFLLGPVSLPLACASCGPFTSKGKMRPQWHQNKPSFSVAW